MYVKEKIIPDESISGMGRRGLKENGGGGEFKCYIFDTL
jgi:hypothetical protein